VATAFVLVNAKVGAEASVLEALRGILEVEEAHLVYGVYDIIARVEAETAAELNHLVAFRIRRIDGVLSTLTMICM